MHQCFKFDVIHFTGYGVIAEKPRVELGRIFRAPCKKNYALDRKMNDTILMASTSSITVQSLGKIIQRAPAVGAKTWCLYVCFYRQDAAKRQTADIKLIYSRPKIRFFAPQGRPVEPIHVKLGMANGHVSSLGCAKFHLNRHRKYLCGLQNIKNFHFLVKSRPAGATPLTDFEIFLGTFI